MASHRAPVWIVALLLCVGALPLAAGELLRLSVLDGPVPAANARTISTRQPTFLTVQSGQTVTLQRTRGRDYRLNDSRGGWAVTSIEQVPAEATAVEITPALAGEEVTLAVSYRSHDAGGSVAFSTTVSGSLGEWLALLGGQPAVAADGGRSLRTGRAQESLSIRVDRAP